MMKKQILFNVLAICANASVMGISSGEKLEKKSIEQLVTLSKINEYRNRKDKKVLMSSILQ